MHLSNREVGELLAIREIFSEDDEFVFTNEKSNIDIFNHVEKVLGKLERIGECFNKDENETVFYNNYWLDEEYFSDFFNEMKMLNDDEIRRGYIQMYFWYCGYVNFKKYTNSKNGKRYFSSNIRFNKNTITEKVFNDLSEGLTYFGVENDICYDKNLNPRYIYVIFGNRESSKNFYDNFIIYNEKHDELVKKIIENDKVSKKHIKRTPDKPSYYDDNKEIISEKQKIYNKRKKIENKILENKKLLSKLELENKQLENRKNLIEEFGYENVERADKLVESW